MARGISLSLLFFLAHTAGVGNSADVADEEINAQIAKLEQILDAQQLQIKSLEAQAKLEERRLMTGSEHLFATPDPRRPSLYGQNSGNTTRAYTEHEEFGAALTHMWLVLCGVLALFMQGGMVMMKMGNCRMKNAQSIFLNHMTDILFATLCWWIFGFTFAYDLESYNADGFKKNHFAGGFHSAFGLGFLLGVDDGRQLDPVYDMPFSNGQFQNGQHQTTGVTPMLVWFFRWTFCSLAATIASSGIAERAHQHCYTIYSICSSSFIFPIVAAWTWGRGWVAGSDSNGNAVFMDFAGSGIVHMVGGIGALVGAIIVGKREGRFLDDSSGNRMRETPAIFDPHSVPLVVLGTFTAWVGAYGLNCGSTMAMNSIEKGFLAGQVAMNTTLATAAGGVTAFILKFALTKKYDVTFFCNGILGGAVSIAAGCGSVECGTAFCIGLVSGFVLLAASTVLKVMRVDDPIDAFAVHGACGMWGLVAAGIFDWGKGFNNRHAHTFEGFRCVMDYEQTPPVCKENLSSSLFGMNMALLFAGALWVAVFAIIIYGALRVMGVLRYDDAILSKAIDDEKFRPPHAYALELREVELKEDYI